MSPRTPRLLATGYDPDVSRLARLKNWPEKLERFDLADLVRERSYWLMRASMGTAAARKECMNRVRVVERVIEERFPGTKQ